MTSPLECLVSKVAQIRAFPKGLAWLASLERAAGFRDGPHWPLSRTVSMGVPQGYGMCSRSYPRPDCLCFLPWKGAEGTRPAL